jgi:hypothetical protein
MTMAGDENYPFRCQYSYQKKNLNSYWRIDETLVLFELTLETLI